MLKQCWCAQIDLQAQARAHRIGQHRPVLVLRLQTVGSIEEHICSVADAKKGLADLTITGAAKGRSERYHAHGQERASFNSLGCFSRALRNTEFLEAALMWD